MDYKVRKHAPELLEHSWITGPAKPGVLPSSSRLLALGARAPSMQQASMLAVSFNLSSQRAQKLRELFQQIDRSDHLASHSLTHS
jgi:hypothetical protein